MFGCTIGEKEIALMYDTEELASLGFDSDLRREDALELIDHALRSEGAVGWTDLEVDVFLSPKALLLIGRKPAIREFCFSFDDAEALISGSRVCGAVEESELYMYAQRYYLLLHTANGSAAAPLREYASEQTALPGPFLREHGEMLIPENAVTVLTNAFAKKDS